MYEIEKRFEQAKAKKKLIESQIETKIQIIEQTKRKVENFIKARYVLSEVTRLTQENFQERVEKLITLAIQSVFSWRDFRFKLHLERKRNKLECRPVIIENEYEYSPEDDMGGGLIDIISFAWRVVLWSMEKPRSRNIIIEDEPMKNMGDLIEFGGKMRKEVSTKLNLQLITITHDPELAETADTSYLFIHKKGRTEAKLMKGFKKFESSIEKNEDNLFPNLPQRKKLKKRSNQ